MFEQAFKNIDDVLWKEAGCTTELDYTEQTSWLLFLKYLDGLEQDRADEAALEGKKYSFILDKPYRSEAWAAPKGNSGGIDLNRAMTGDDLREALPSQPEPTPGSGWPGRASLIHSPRFGAPLSRTLWLAGKGLFDTLPRREAPRTTWALAGREGPL